MVAPVDMHSSQPSMAVNLQFTRGRHGAAARIELHEQSTGRVATIALRGWVDLSAERGIERALEDLASRGIDLLLVDCSQLRHIDYRMVPRLVDALARFETRTGSYLLCGLSHYLRDLFRLAGCDAHLRGCTDAAALVNVPRTFDGPRLGTAS
jgi:anti-anti-sigma regulatory factor